MLKCILIQKETIIEELEKRLGRKANYSVKSSLKDDCEVVIDTIEIDGRLMSKLNKSDLSNVAEHYEVVDDKIVIELSNMTSFFESFFPGEKIKKYDFIESNMFGVMEECLSLHLY